MSISVLPTLFNASTHGDMLIAETKTSAQPVLLDYSAQPVFSFEIKEETFTTRTTASSKVAAANNVFMNWHLV